ncbi:MAG: CobW family GTP-binding protein [Thiomicrorhabdus sp.]|nr:CobW family GTP-binding protein [Thiomicrorhabdus sp.]
MFKIFQKKIAINLITGTLGAGKTTLLRQLIAQKPSEENWGILVNEFGAIGIDGSIFESQQNEQSPNLQIHQIPGGCICCTAQNELKDTIQNIIKNHKLDRLLIEPTGLGEPDTLVDLLQSSLFKKHFNIQSIFAVVDSNTMTLAEIQLYTILQNLFTMADVIVLNKADIAQAANLQALQNYAEDLFPQKRAIITTSQGQVPIELVNKETNNKPLNKQLITLFDRQPPSQNAATHHNQAAPTSKEFTSNIQIPGLVTRQIQTQISTRSIGWLFDDSVIFDWTAILTLFKSFSDLPASCKPKRAKGVFRVGKPWMLFQWVNDQTSREYIAYRKDSRIELLLPENSHFDVEKFENTLKNCLKTD